MDKPTVQRTEEVSIGRFVIVKNTMNNGVADYPYSYIKIKPGVIILPLLGDQIMIIRQYRVALDQWLYELPAGMIDSDDSSPEMAAAREVEEETGYHAGRMEPLGYFYPSQGSTNEICYLFAASELTPTQKSLDLGEQIETLTVSPKQLMSMIMDQTMVHSGGIIAFFKYLEKHRPSPAE